MLPLSILLLATSTRAANTIIVTTLVDKTTTGGGCSLRQAITNANNEAQTYADCPAGTGNDVINFTAGLSGTIDIHAIGTLPTITNTLTIDGTGATIDVSGGNSVRVL